MSVTISFVLTFIQHLRCPRPLAKSFNSLHSRNYPEQGIADILTLPLRKLRHDKLVISKITNVVTVDLPDPQSLSYRGGQQMEDVRSLRIIENRFFLTVVEADGVVAKFMSQLCPLLAVWPWPSHPTSLCPPSLTIKWILQGYSESPGLVLFWFFLLR